MPTHTPSFALSSLTLALVASTGLAQGTCAEEPLLENHTGPGAITCPCFVAGEEAGAVFDVPPDHYPIEILRIGIGWGSLFGGGTQSLEQAIKVYPGALPNPGSPIFQLDGPVLIDGFVNEFDLDPLPGEVIVPSGPFSVTLEFANASQPPLGASMVHDGAGCIPGRNLVLAIPGGWNDACSLGVTGNWQVHLVYRRTDCGGNSTFCVTSNNSVGGGSLIGFQGTTSISAQDLFLTAVANPSSQFGVFFYGENEVQIPFGDGFRCVGAGPAGLIRFAPQQIDFFGNVVQPVDYATPPTGSGPGQILSGSTWKFQFWYRDPAALGTGFNLSNGLSLTFEP